MAVAIPGRPILSGLVECTRAPEYQRNTEQQPPDATTVKENVLRCAEPYDQPAKQNENNFDREAERFVGREWHRESPN